MSARTPKGTSRLSWYYGSIKSILANNLDRRPAPQRSADDLPILHANIGGPRYYN